MRRTERSMKMINRLNLSKKALAFLLAFSVLISTVTVNLAVFADVSPKTSGDTFTEGIKGAVWNGEVATGYAGGTGTKTDPYLIETPNQLAYMLRHDVVATADKDNKTSASMGKYYKLTANIYLNDVTDPEWMENSPNSWFTTDSAERFGGNIDGDGYTIFGLYFNGTAAGALIPYADIWGRDISFKNINISDSYISSSGYFVSALVGYIYGGTKNTVTYSKCYVSESVTIKTTSQYAGGLLGCSANKEDKYVIEDCAVLGSVSASGGYSAGFCGYFYAANVVKINDSFALGSFGTNIDEQNNSYTVSNLSKIKGDAAKTEMPNLDWKGVWEVTENYPVLQIAKPGFDIWDGKTAAAYAGGSGTADDPYLIADGSQLALMLSEGDNSKDKYYELAANIYLNDVFAENWKDNSPRQWYSYNALGKKYFQGNFNGANHAVYGMYYKGKDNSVGLIPAAKGTVSVSNLHVYDSYIESDGYALATVIGYVGSGNYKAVKCYVHESNTVKCNLATENNAAGGLFGFGTGEFTVEASAVVSERITVGTTGKVYNGAIVANTWSSKVSVKNTFTNGVFGKEPGIAKSADNCYTTVADPVYGTDVCDAEKMKGTGAKDAMPYLDWNKTWTVSNSGYPKFKPEETEESEIWDGSVAKRYAGGSGTAADPYLISYGSQLAKMAIDSKSAGAYYKLTGDIKLNDTSAENWKATAEQWQWNKNIFAGTLDGAGCRIIGLYYDGDQSSVGLFCYAKDATIKNLILTDSYIRSSGFGVGALVGNANSGTVKITDCVAEDSVSVESTYNTDGNKGAGGLVGYGGAAVVIESSAYEGTVKAPGNAGALAGNCWGTVTVKNSFAVPEMKLCTKKGLDAESANNYSTFSGSETGVTTVTAEQMRGKNALINMPLLTGWAATEKYPSRFYEGVADEVWSGVTSVNYAGGAGSKNDPYIIETAEQLFKLVNDISTAGKFYKITKDIKLNDTSVSDWKATAKQWVSTATFAGTLNGGGHTISGLYYNGNESRVALFRYAKDAEIKRIVLDNAYVYSTDYGTGAFVGMASSGTVKISECYATESVSVESTLATGNDRGAGGFVGYGGGTVVIENSGFTGSVKAPGFPGAFAGNCWGTVTVRGSFTTSGVKFCTKKGLSDSYNNYGNGAAEASVTKLTAEQMKGEEAKTNMPLLNWEVFWKTTSGYPVCRFLSPDGTPGERWTGAVAENYAGGDGSEKNPYLIATGEQLAKAVQDNESTGKYYKIIEDIKLNDTSAADWKTTAKQWIWNSNIFRGNMNGDCHTVSGLYYNGTASKIGIFCYAKDANIKRIKLTDSYIYTTGFAAGAILGDANSGSINISDCYVTDTVYVESAYDKGGDKGAGGLVGYGGATVIIDTCAFLGTVKAPGNAGAFLGNCWGSFAVKNSFAVQPIKFCSKKGLGGASVNNYGTGADAETGVTRVTAEQMKGADAKKNMPLLNWVRSWKVSDSYPVLNVGEDEGVPGRVWSGRLATGFAGGKGTADDPYLISTPEQLAYLVNDLYMSVGNYYKVTDDIYLNNVKNSNWENESPNQWFWVSSARTGNFNGHIDGDGHVVYGIYLDVEQTTDVLYTGLFPTISDGTVIEKLGVAESHIKVHTDKTGVESYAGGFSGYVFFNKGDSEYVEKGVNFPKISQCFGDTSVTLEAAFCGGIVAGAPRPADINDCYFVGKLIGERVGGIVGNSWTEYEGATVTHCYSATADADLLGNGKSSVTNSSTPINYTENYANSTGLGNMVTQVSLLMMRGDAARKNMLGLDFDNVWQVLPNGTPVLKIFGTTDKFSNTSQPKPIELSFVSNGGTEVDPIYGNPEEKANLPIPTKEGYSFEGWYVYRELDFKFDIDYFPYFDQILYAKWTPNGKIQDFEEYPNTMYDTGKDYELYMPGVTDYNANYVRNGTASMHRIGADSSDSDFLVMYEDMLTVGKKYTLTIWATADKSGTQADLSLVHENWPDVYDTDSGVELIKTVTLEDGEWQKIEYTFIARTKWIALRTSGNASVFFDDIMVSLVSDEIYPVKNTTNTDKNTGDTDITDNNGQISDNTYNTNNTDNDNTDNKPSGGKKVIKKRIKKARTGTEESNILIPVVIISGAVAAAALIIVIIAVKRRKSKKQTKTL